MKRKMSRREFLSLAGATGSAVILAACAPATQLPAKATAVPQPTTGNVGETVAPAATTQPNQPTLTMAPPSKGVVTIVVNAYTPSDWTTTSAEHPTVTNAPRILADKFKSVEPNIEIKWLVYQAPAGMSGDTGYGAWLTALVAAGNVPDIISPLHFIPVQQGLCLPLDSYLDQPNPYAPKYAAWKDIFFPNLLASCKYGSSGNIYNIPLQVPYPGIEVGMVYNQDWMTKLGLKPPTTWTEQLEVCKAMKEAGSGLSPWPSEAKEGNVWPVALQLLVSELQNPECPKMDTNNDVFVSVDEAVPAFQNGLIGPLTPKYQTAWLELKKLAGYWIDGWSTADLATMWRNGQIGALLTGAWDFTTQKNDPLIKFERAFSPCPYVTSKDVVGGNDPPEFTAGDGKIPGELVTLINGPDDAITTIAQKRGTTEAAVKWLQFLSVPENMAFLDNENEDFCVTSPDAPLGPLFAQLATFKIPKWKYSISWWGEGLYYSDTEFNDERKEFVAWMTGQVNDATFFSQLQKITSDGCAEYVKSMSATATPTPKP